MDSEGMGMTKFWYDKNGDLLQATSDDVDSVDGAEGFTQVAPESGLQKWNGTGWDALPEPDYREKRKAAYISQLSGGTPTFEEATGDVLDAIIKHIYGDTIELDALATKIAAIKAANPKPQ
jgi:hypothetical protein